MVVVATIGHRKIEEVASVSLQKPRDQILKMNPGLVSKLDLPRIKIEAHH